jgi:hypothetical protein
VLNPFRKIGAPRVALVADARDALPGNRPSALPGNRGSSRRARVAQSAAEAHSGRCGCTWGTRPPARQAFPTRSPKTVPVARGITYPQISKRAAACGPFQTSMTRCLSSSQSGGRVLFLPPAPPAQQSADREHQAGKTGAGDGARHSQRVVRRRRETWSELSRAYASWAWRVFQGNGRVPTALTKRHVAAREIDIGGKIRGRISSVSGVNGEIVGWV